MQYYVASDAFILASLEETWGLVVNEAMIAGLPVFVSSHAGSSQDLVKERENGFVFDPTNPDSFATTMSLLAKQPQQLSAMGNASKEKIATITLEQNIEVIKKLKGEMSK
jgi:glycosyltransferase involved in cell wall biosynthesis